MIAFSHAACAAGGYFKGMASAVPRTMLALSLLLGAAGCGGGEAGPRGELPEGAGPMTQSRISMRTVMYIQGRASQWASQLSFANIGYVNLSFAEVMADGTVSYLDTGLPSFVDRAHEAGTKVCLAIGGAGTIDDGGVFATLLKDDQRGNLVDNLVAFARANELDCLDIDLEGNGVNEYYEAFVTELDARLAPEGKELTAAVAGWFGDRISDRALATFDFINVMAYDLYQSRNTPMQTSSIEASQREVDRWVARGVPPDKVVYGVPFYGFEWPVGGGEPIILGYKDLLNRNAAATTQDDLSSGDKIVFHNSRATIQAKTLLAKQYGGIMAWELGQDAPGDDSLVQAIREASE
jgi:spore germination protein YaaH